LVLPFDSKAQNSLRQRGFVANLRSGAAFLEVFVADGWGKMPRQASKRQRKIAHLCARSL